MNKTILTVGDFSGLLDQLGADLTRWPAETRAAADALLQADPAAAALLAEALALEDGLKAIQPKAPKGLADRILAASGADKPKH